MEGGRSDPYTNLPPGYIRLLHISADTAVPQVGELRVVPLGEAPLYYALSHCWGDRSKHINIVIGGTSISILYDLYAAIQRLRALATITTDCLALSPPLDYIWIDSICINQQNAHERSTQVEMMGTIYSLAIRTVVWLGPAFHSSYAAWGIVDDIYDRFRAETPAAQTLEDIPLCTYSDAAHARFGLPAWDNPVWSRLKQLFDLPWFSRIWVIQEVVRSSRDPIVIHGQTMHSWERLGWAAAWLRRKGYTRLPQISQQTLNVDTLCILRRSRAAWPLEALLSITQVKFRASDPRDKVWSLLGLAAESCPSRGHDSRGGRTKTGRSVGGIPYELRPDYTLSPTQAYRRVGRYLLTHSRSSALLTRTRGPVDSLSRTRRIVALPGLPTWVPDWSDFEGGNRHIRTSFSWVHYASDPEQQPAAVLGYPENYTAAARTHLRVCGGNEASGVTSVYDTRNESILRVGGILVTQVERVVSLNKAPTCREKFRASFDDVMVRIVRAALPILYRDTLGGVAAREVEDRNKDKVQHWVADLIKVTTADQQHSSGGEARHSLPYGSWYLRNLLLGRREDILLWPRSALAIRAYDAILDSLGTDIGLRPEVVSDQQVEVAYVSLARNFCFNRTFLITGDGRMGLGPSAAQNGDTVAVMFGGGVPFVLRPSARSQAEDQNHVVKEERDGGQEYLPCYWEVVGESYILGLMNGEAVEASRQGTIKERILALV